jgi:ribosomal protein S18 acetylase RimI-like enzyme
LCQSLLEKVEHVGLNVKADNDAAIACYRKLGFEVVAPYGEFTVEQKSGS